MKKSSLAALLIAAIVISAFPVYAFASAATAPDRLPDEPAAVAAPAVAPPEDMPEAAIVTVDPTASGSAQSAPAAMTAKTDTSPAAVQLPDIEGSQLMLTAWEEAADETEAGSGIPAIKMDMYLGDDFAGTLYFTTDGTAATLAHTENLTGAVKVPERFEHEGTTYRVTKIGQAALFNQTGLTQIWLPGGLEEIGAKAFSGCDHLKAVGSYAEDGYCDPYALPAGLTNIWPSTFYGCTRLSSVKIGADVEEIWHYAFAYCYSLGQNYTDENGVTYGVYFGEGSRLTHIHQGAFMKCIVLDNITLPDGLTYIGPDAFSQCTAIMEQNGQEEYVGLKNVVIPNSVQTIGEKAFQYCFTLETLSIPASVETIEDKAFYSCSHLRDLEFRGTGDKPIEMGTMVFYWCRSLENIQLPANLKILPAWTFAYAGYYGQPDVVLPEGMEKIGQYAFNESGIRSITFPSTITDVAMLAFGDCHALTTINWPQKAPGEDPLSLGMMAFTDCENLTALTLPRLHITSGDNIFYDCDNLRTVNVADDAAFIPAGAFRDCDNLTAVTLPAGLLSVHAQAFYSCPSLTDVNLAEAAGLQTIGDLAFCRTALPEVTIPAAVKSIGKEAFGINRSLLSFTVAANNAGGYRAADGILYQDTGDEIHLVRYPAGVKDMAYVLPEGVTHIDAGACSHSEHLVTVTFPASLKQIGDYAFSHCINLKTAEVGKDVRQGSLIFDQCYQLAALTIPEGTTVIGKDGYDPTPLAKATTITIPASVTDIYAGGLSIGGVPAIGSNFQNLPLLESIEVATGNQNFVAVDGVLFSKDMTTLIAYPAAKAGETYTVPDTVDTIAAYAFMNVSNLKQVVIPAGVENISFCALYAPLERVDFYRDFTQISTGISGNAGYIKMFNSDVNGLQVYIQGDPTDPDGAAFIEDFTKCGCKAQNVHIGFIRPVTAAGDKFCVDGVIYTLADPAAQTVTVGANRNYAKSHVTIPAQVTHNAAAYTVTAVEPGAFAEAEALTTASVMLPAAQIGAGAFASSVNVTSRDTMTGFMPHTRYLAYGDTLVVATPAAVAEGTEVTLTGANGSVSANVIGGTAVFPVDKAFYDAVASGGQSLDVTISGGSVTTANIPLIVSPKTYGPADVPWYNPVVHTYFFAKPYDGTDVVDVTTAAPLADFLVEGDDVAIRFYNGTCCYIDAAPNMNDPFRGDIALVGKDAGYYAISPTLLARPQDYFACHVDFGQLYIKEVDGVLQKPLFRRVWSTEDKMRVRDCGLGGGQFVAYIPTSTENGVVTAYETVDVEGYFVYTDPNPYPAFQDSGDFPIYAGSVYRWDFIPSGNDRQELLQNYRFSGSFMPWDPALAKDDSDGATNNLIGAAGENPPLPGYVKIDRPAQEELIQPEIPDQPNTEPAQTSPAVPTDKPDDDHGSSAGGSSSGGSSSSSKAGTSQNMAVKVNDLTVTKAVNSVQKGEPVVLKADVPDNATAAAVSLSAKNLQTIAESSGDGLTLQTPLAEITLDSKAMAMVRGNSAQDTVISVRKLTNADLPRKAADAAASAPVYDLSVTAAGKTVADFGEGNIRVSIPCADTTGDWLVCRMADDGTLTPVVKSAMVDGAMRFTVSHLSTYVVTANTAQFRDTQNHWGKADIYFSAGRGIVQGVDGENFQPEAPVTTAAAVTVLGRLSGVADAPNAADWAKPHLAWAEAAGILPDGIAPDAPISREQLAYMLSRYMGEGDGADVTYTDLASVNPDYLSSIRRVRQLGLMHGKENNTFDPQGSLTRAELAAVLHRLVLAELS